jgi:hypothetical protein
VRRASRYERLVETGRGVKAVGEAGASKLGHNCSSVTIGMGEDTSTARPVLLVRVSKLSAAGTGMRTSEGTSEGTAGNNTGVGRTPGPALNGGTPQLCLRLGRGIGLAGTRSNCGAGFAI